MKALIIDDERIARREMRRLLQEHPEIEIVGEADQAATALALLPVLRPDLLFLDIQMPGMDGFDLLAAMPPPQPQVIFCTAYDDYALRAFAVNALDYLLKPVDPLRLTQALNRLQPPGEEQEIRPQAETMMLQESDRVLLKGAGKSWFVPVRQIQLLESEGNYTTVHFDEGKVLLPRSLQSLQNRLALPCFFRANRAQLVNLRAVTQVADWFSGGLKVTLRNGAEVEISRRQASLFRQQKSL